MFNEHVLGSNGSKILLNLRSDNDACFTAPEELNEVTGWGVIIYIYGLLITALAQTVLTSKAQMETNDIGKNWSD